MKNLAFGKTMENMTLYLKHLEKERAIWCQSKTIIQLIGLQKI